MSSVDISVIMPSFLGEYQGAASYRVNKLRRAVLSYLYNNNVNSELIVVADGCNLTMDVMEILNNEFTSSFIERKVSWTLINKQDGGYGAQARNYALRRAVGEVITYLDTDDYIGCSHLHTIVSNFSFSLSAWVYYNDYVAVQSGSANGLMRASDVRTRENVVAEGRIGTSSISHVNFEKHPEFINSEWKITWGTGYGHDWRFIESLLKNSGDPVKIKTPEYVVCHIPGQIDL